MLSKKLILSSLTSLLVCNAHLIADESAQDEITQENSEISIDGHVSVRSREMDSNKRQQMQRLRAKQDETEDDNGKTDAQRALRNASNKLASSQSEFMFAPRGMTNLQIQKAAYSFPINCHWLMSIADTGRSFEIEDGSHWEVSPADAYILRSWRREDSLVITPNYSWLSSYDYYITNKSSNSYVKANLYVGPTAFGAYSHWIVAIDYLGGHVHLENQMIWCVNPQDSYLLKDWAVNDHIIFGLNDSWFTPFNHILINVNMDNHIRVKQY